MSTGYSGTRLAKKLGIREGARVWLAGAPDDLLDELRPLPSSSTVERTGRIVRVHEGPDGQEDVRSTLTVETMPAGRFDVVLLFCPDARALEAHFGPAVSRLRWAGGLWACWPKKSSSLHADLGRERVRTVGLRTGLVDNKVCAVNGDWSGLRFVVRREDRPAYTEEGGPDA